MNSVQEVREMRTAEMELSIIRERGQRGLALTKMATGEPCDAEIGQARFGGGRLGNWPSYRDGGHSPGNSVQQV